MVVAYNALGQARNETLRLPVPAGASLAVYDWRVRWGRVEVWGGVST